MNTNLTTLPLASSLLDAAITMRRSSVRHLPVVDAERIVGIITERDVQRWHDERDLRKEKIRTHLRGKPEQIDDTWAKMVY